MKDSLTMTPPPEPAPLNFIEQIVEEDNRTSKYQGRVQTRFPPEPNGYLHVGHAKSICLNFGLAQKYGGGCNLRMDDTNPVKEESEYIEQLYEWAELLITKGKAFVCDLTAEEISKMRGGPRGDKPSPYRDRSVE